MAAPINTPLTGDIWHLSIDDLLAPLPEAPRLGGPGPFVINLSVSTAPIGLPMKPIARHLNAHVYQIQRVEDGRTRYRLRLGPFADEDNADAVLMAVRDIYPSALTATAGADDLRVIATMQAKVDAQQPPADKPAKPPAPMSISAAAPPLLQMSSSMTSSPVLTAPMRSPPVTAASVVTAQVQPSPATPPLLTTPLQSPSVTAPSVLMTQVQAPPVVPPVLTTPLQSPSLTAPPVLTTQVQPPPGARPVPTTPMRSPPATPPLMTQPALTPVRIPTIGAPQAVAPLTLATPAPSTIAPAVAAPPLRTPAARTPPVMTTPVATTPLAPPPAPTTPMASQVPVTSVSAVRTPPILTTPVAAPAPAPRVMAPTASAAAAPAAAAPAAAASTRPPAPSAVPPLPAQTPPTPVPRLVERLSEPLANLESTQTVRLLTSVELEDEQALRWYVIQLSLSDQAFDPDTVPNLDIFSEYRLYSVAAIDQGQIMHALRLGFFGEEAAAVAVASYLAEYYDKPSVKRVSAAERERFSDRVVEARKDIGATGRHTVIEITDELVVRKNRITSPLVTSEMSNLIFGQRSASRDNR
jgi:hypothetical protein